MGELQNATDQVRLLAKGFKAFLQVVEAADRLGGIEQGEREAVSRREAANKAADQAEAEKDAAKERMERAKQQAVENERKAQAILEQAQTDAAGITGKAAVKASQILADAEKAKVAAHADAASARELLVETGNAIVQKKKELAAVEKAIADLRAVASTVARA